MLDDTELYHRVVDFVSTKTGTTLADISPGSRLMHDLHMDGEDAEFFIGVFNDAFHVDASTFNFYRDCFHVQPWWDIFTLPIGWLAWLYVKLAKPSSYERVPLTVQDLYQAAKLGKWVWPNRQPEP